jgi:hypothetical protein
MKNNIKYLLTIMGLLLVNVTLWACPVCEQQQPKITQGFTHGVGPQSNWDWVIISVIAAITLATFIFSIKYLIKPGEKNSNHIKASILNN